MSRGRTDGLVATLLALVMVATALAAGWLVLSSGVLGGTGARPSPEPTPAVAANVAPHAGRGRIEPNASFQVAQPRDPFRPLVTPESSAPALPGGGGEAGGGVVPGKTVTLVEIRDVNGTLRATIIVNGVTYDVAPGETFADAFAVVKLTADAAVLMYGDTVFQLSTGQQILK